MDKNSIFRALEKKIKPDNIFIDEMMADHTSFKIGGPADLFVMPQNVEELLYALSLCKEQNIPYYILGNGSDLLVTDKGYRGMMIQIYKNMSDVQIDGTKVLAEAGVLLSTLSKKIAASGLTGFEFASGIPGTLGGAVYMNAGAYDGEMKQILVSADVINEDGELITLSREELDLRYRSSIVQKKGYIVVKASMELEEGDPVAIQAKIDDLMGRRKSKQPLEMPSAGSTFKRPTGYYAGKLIMDAGLRGYQIGGAQVSEKHCGFVVNCGNGTAADVLALIEHIQKTVEDKFGVSLEPEVRIVGEK